MFNSKTPLMGKVLSVLFSAAIALTAIPVSFAAETPVTVKAYSEDDVKDALNYNQKKIYDAYVYLDSRIKEKDLKITKDNLASYNSDTLFTMYEGASDKFVYKDEDLRYARRAYINTNPYEIAGAMAKLNIIYIKNKDKKYDCYAYMTRVDNNDYSKEKKALQNAVSKIMNKIDDDKDSEFDLELQCFKMIIDNVTHEKTPIDDLNLRNTAYGALVNHKASYMGYALAFKCLLDECDLENNILFDEVKEWNQVKVGSKRYDVYIVGCDKAKSGTVDYRYFNISETQMKNRAGLKRCNYTKNLPASKGTAKDTSKKMIAYDDEIMTNSKNMTLAVLEDDGTIARTTMTSTEQTAKFVPIIKLGASLVDLSANLKSVTLTAPADFAFDITQEWTTASRCIVLTKNNDPAKTNRTCSVAIVYNDDTAKPITYNVTIADKDDTRGSTFAYKVTGAKSVTLVKCKKTGVKNVTIPSVVTINGTAYKVTKIDKNAFKKCKKLETVILGSYVKEVGKNAFSGKTKLIRVESLGYDLNKIGKDAFKSTNGDTMFLLRAKTSNKYKSLVNKIKKAGAKDSVFKRRA